MDFDFTDYVVVYDRKYDSGLIFLKDSLKDESAHFVPIVYGTDHYTCVGYAELEYRDNGVVAHCKFNDSDIGQLAKTLVVDERVFDVSFFAVGIKREDGIVKSGQIRAVILTLARPKILED